MHAPAKPFSSHLNQRNDDYYLVPTRTLRPALFAGTSLILSAITA
jgi:hypothetical protein